MKILKVYKIPDINKCDNCYFYSDGGGELGGCPAWCSLFKDIPTSGKLKECKKLKENDIVEE